MTPEQVANLQARLITYVNEHGPDALLSPRARREQDAFRRRLQAIMDGPIPQQALGKHSSLLQESGRRASH